MSEDEIVDFTIPAMEPTPIGLLLLKKDGLWEKVADGEWRKISEDTPVSDEAKE